MATAVVDSCYDMGLNFFGSSLIVNVIAGINKQTNKSFIDV